MKQASDGIIENNSDFMVALKPAGQLSQKSQRGDTSLQNSLEAYQKKSLHILTRLDRPVSGLVLFSKSKEFASHYSGLQQASKISKEYLAIVQGDFPADLNTITHHHFHDKVHKKARLTEGPAQGHKEVTLQCTVVKKLERYSVLGLTLTSGRFHQIRAQLGAVGHPIKGDVKYGARRGNKDRSIHLHAHRILFEGPGGEHHSFEAPLPDEALWQIVKQQLNP